MNVFKNLHNLPHFKNAVLTIGSFDGVHNGHQKILERVKELAQQYNGESIVITFHPHPRLIIYPKDNSLQLITTVEEKISLFERYNIDNVVVVPFSVEFSQQSADEYIQKFLVEKFAPRCVVVGYDHKFGLNRQGDINYLKAATKNFKFDVFEISKQDVDDVTVSSTKIRNALNSSDIKSANRLLGHLFSLSGAVVKGQRIGHTIGFPTANIEITEKHKLIPPFGIYACQVWIDEKQYGGMLYIGDRPTLKDHENRTIEVNIFDFDKDIYGQKIRIDCLDFVRPDAKFDDLTALQAAIAQDKTAALRILNAYQKQELSKKKI